MEIVNQKRSLKNKILSFLLKMVVTFATIATICISDLLSNTSFGLLEGTIFARIADGLS